MKFQNEDLLQPMLYKSEKKSELSSRLVELHKYLGTIGQEDRPKGLDLIAKLLASKKFIQNAEKDIRLTSLCCLADILRIYAPEPPLEDPEILHIFEGFIGQIRNLSTVGVESNTGSNICYIINSLATVKSCVVPVILSLSGVQDAREVVLSLFDALLSSANADLPDLGELVC
jgi:sister-chromatid-cohesion protein PDS5